MKHINEYNYCIGLCYIVKEPLQLVCFSPQDTYHTYATISEEQAALVMMNMLYASVKKYWNVLYCIEKQKADSQNNFVI